MSRRVFAPPPLLTILIAWFMMGAYSAVRSGDWKLIAFHDPKSPAELYNLAADPHETTDRAAEQAERVTAMGRTLDSWKRSTGARDATVNGS